MNNTLPFRAPIFLCSILFLCTSCVNRPPIEATILALPDHPASLRDSNELRFTDQWQFFKGDDAKACNPDFDDRNWRTVDLPHDWSIEGPFDEKFASCTAYLPTGIGWYRKAFILPPDTKDKSVRIRFDGISNHSTVWCNGILLGQRPYGYSSFTYDLTPTLHWGTQPNVIAVRVDHEHFADSRWYAGSGIYRNVYLTIADKIHVDTNGTFVTTPNTTSDSAEVDFQTIVCNENRADADLNVVTTIKDQSGNIIVTLMHQDKVAPKSQKSFAASSTIPAPALWSPDHPALYTAVTQVKKADQILDQYTTVFGIRTFAFDAAKGFSLNSQTMKIKGVCVHHDAGALGAAVPIQVWERRLAILREAGCNAIRCSHNPPAPEFLDLCDRMGFLVMDEAFDEWTRGKKKWIQGVNVGDPAYDGYHSDFDQWADTDIRDMVQRDRNHPSIILWSIGNEIDYRNDAYPPNSPELAPIADRLIKDVKSLDITRPVTAACAAPSTNRFKQLLDVEGYNYMERLYDGDHAIHPERILIGSENSQTLAAWQAVEDDDYIAGQFLWTGIDYLGEASGWPAHASPAGLLDLAGFKKDQFYFRQSLWTDAPMLYLSTTAPPVRRKHPATATAPASAPVAPPPPAQIYCLTNCDRVELIQDGVSLGEKAQSPTHIISWPLKFTSGRLHAIGHKGDARITFDLDHSGPPAKLTLHSDVQSLASADDDGIAQIELDVVDANGTLVPTAAPLINCTITGPARLLGIENGNIRSTESEQASSHSAYHGRMMIYLQSLKTPGEITLTVSAPNLDNAAISLPSR